MTAPTDEELAKRSALLRLPEWFLGPGLQEFAERARWRLEPRDSESNTWGIRLKERVLRKPAHLVRVERVATATNADKAGTYARLAPYAKPKPFNQILSPERVRAERARLARERPRDITAVLWSGVLAIVSTPPEQLTASVQQFFRDSLLPRLPESAVHLVEIDPALRARYTATRALLVFHDDPDLKSRLMNRQKPKGLFTSGWGLLSDTSLGLDAYLSPLFLSLSPWVWAVSVSRLDAVIVFTFGEAIDGRLNEPAEFLQFFLPVSTSRPTPHSGPPTVSAADIDEAMQWWVRKLDVLFTEITDPVNSISAKGDYDARYNFTVLLSVEQAFRNVQSLLAHQRDPHVRRGLLFDTLDTLQGLRGPDFKRMCELSYAHKTLTGLENSLSAGASRVLLPRARAAVTALEEVQNGFFLPSRRVGNQLRVQNNTNKGDELISLETAAVWYLRMLRNAGHGFGGKTSHAEKDAALLISHKGDLSTDLPDLAYLYLLRLLDHPEQLRRA